MAEENKSDIGYIENCFIAAKASLNASAIGKEKNSVPLMNCGIETLKIQTLGEYLAKQKAKENPSLNMNDEIDALLADDKLARCFVIPVILPNGEEVEVIVNSKGQDMACMYRDEEGNQKTFELTPRMKKEIDSAFPQELEQIVGEKVLEEIKADYLPENVEELAENISKDELVPEKRKVLQKVNEKNGAKEETEEQKKEKENAEKEIPPETRDIIAKICSENDLDITSLKEVMEVPPQTISENLEGTGFKNNNGRITCLRFKDGEKLQGRVVMVQGDKVVDNRTYDDYMNDYMNEHKGEKRVDSIEDEHDNIEYTDIDGNTTRCEIRKEPRDLSCTKKEEIQQKMYELDMKTNQVLAADEMPPEMKAKAFASLNQERLDTFKEYGVEAPTVESEIEADIEIAEEIQNEIGENQGEQQPQEEIDDIEAFEVPGKRTR